MISLAYLPLTLWLLARALERSSWRLGVAAGVLGGLMAIGRDQVALLVALRARRLRAGALARRRAAARDACARASSRWPPAA